MSNKRWMTVLVGVALAATAAGCYKLDLGNGQLKCAVPDRKCPDGFHCATDGYCWKNGQDPVDMAGQTVPDMATSSPDLATFVAGPPSKGGAVVSGGVTAQSPNYKIIMSTGQAPGGNNSASSTKYQLKGGLPGATQK
jgi:hypothetical protein